MAFVFFNGFEIFFVVLVWGWVLGAFWLVGWLVFLGGGGWGVFVDLKDHLIPSLPP